MTQLEKELPQNRDAERAVLGSILIDPDRYTDVAPLLSPSDFSDPRHQVIFTAIETHEGKGTDLLVVREALQRSGKLSDAGGLTYLSSLVDQIPDIGNVRRYAGIVREMSIRRKVTVEGHRLQLAAAATGEGIDELCAEASAFFAELGRSAEPSRLRTIGQMVRLGVKRLEHRAQSGNYITGIEFGIPPVDAVTLGVQEGVLSILGARPKSGKTAICIGLGIRTAEHGKRTLFIQLDMNETMVGDRALATAAGVDYYHIRTGQFLQQKDWTRIALAEANLHNVGDRFVISFGNRQLKKIAAEIRREAKKGLGLILIDHIGLIRGAKGRDRRLEIADITSTLVELAGETSVPILALSQLNRDVEKRDSPPRLSDLREAGEIEQDARLVILLDRPALRDDEQPKCRLNWIIEKNEGEAPISVETHYDLTRQRIREAPAEDETCRFCPKPESTRQGSIPWEERD